MYYNAVRQKAMKFDYNYQTKLWNIYYYLHYQSSWCLVNVLSLKTTLTAILGRCAADGFFPLEVSIEMN